MPAAEAGQHDAAVAHVLLAVQQQDRVGADDGAEEAVGVAGAEDLGVAGHHLLGQARVGDHDHGGRAHPHREQGAVAARQRSISGIGRNIQRRVCRAPGELGPGGSPSLGAATELGERL